MVYENGEFRMSSVSNAIIKLNDYARLKIGSDSAGYKEIYAFGEAITTVLGAYKAMIPEVLKQNEVPGIDDPISYYGEESRKRLFAEIDKTAYGDADFFKMLKKKYESEGADDNAQK
jgi:hypothetical protein